MRILHGTWIPQAEPEFLQTGAFYLWVETTDRKRSKKTSQTHPNHLARTELAAFLTEMGVKVPLDDKIALSPNYFLLPSSGDRPLPSLELARYLEEEPPEAFEWQYWQIDCHRTLAWVKTSTTAQAAVNNVIKLLNDLHFVAFNNLVEDVQLGADLLFWYHYTQSLKQVILKDHYIPALKYRLLAAAKSAKTKRKAAEETGKATFEIHPGWEILSDQYEADLQRYADWMPLVCVSGFAKLPDSPQFYDKERLLRHCSECLLTDIVTHTPTSAAFEQKISDTLLSGCLHPDPHHAGSSPLALEQYQQWQSWRDRINQSQTALSFYLCFQLQSPVKPEEPWQLEFQVSPRQEPSLRIPLLDYWRLKSGKASAQQKALQKQLGKDFEQKLLTNLGYAARIYPKLWAGLETDEPTSVLLSTPEASEFLQEPAWVLEDAGYKVIVPAWWTPKGWQRAKIRLRTSGRKAADSKKKSYFSFNTLVDYQYELSINGEPVSEREWQALVNAKTSLVQFRGQWMELDRDQMQRMLEFWQQHKQENPELTLLDLMKMSASSEDGIPFEVDHDETLAEMLEKLNDKSRLEVMPDLQQFQGTLRTYQKRGVSWLYYLESLGLNGCLADDMGMGKSAQVIARLVQEREPVAAYHGSNGSDGSDGKTSKTSKTRKASKTSQTAETTEPIPPTLLIAPTSVVGNWQKEIEKFAPHLRAIVHHGSSRIQDAEAFQAAVADCDVLITSFTLARKDEKLLSGVTWQRLVVDEAQNMKNPKAAQTKAILKLPAQHRLALTGTPIENRLLDLWSIFNFLNPGYLGKESQFRQSFEIPIQKNNDAVRATTLKKLVEPFILRRVKTDPAIIQDLPDKVEQKLFCNLTKEQASLYEAVVKDIEKQLESAEGIQRRGLILSTLLRLKQICNHPRQFLQDGSDFTPERSHKLERLSEMVQEAIDEGESLLIFTQFTEIGEALEKYVKHTLHYSTYYLHGGTNRQKRETMITEFQDPETEPSVFILSLKAGGVGITLTKANHVFHFDRWWNPAVEDQATDRAFRIGQKKNVFVHKFVAIGTLEERIDQMIEDKKKLAGSIVGSDEAWLTELDNEAFKKLIALNRTAVLD